MRILPQVSTVLLILLSAGCVTAISPEKAGNIDPAKTGLVLATLKTVGEAEDVKKVTIEFYVRPTEGRGSMLKDLVMDSSKDLWLIEVPPGHYQISDWFLNGGTLRRETAEQRFEFEVRSGEITYIGNFEVQVKRGKNTFGLRVIPLAIPTLGDDYAGGMAAFRERYPALATTAVRNAAPAMFLWTTSESKPIPLQVPPSVLK